MEFGMTDLASESAAINEDEEFYENLEAPKYVDLTAPDPLRYDDGSWFCVKIGCDQNHEHVDPEALNKNFMLRVMAARSPNVRLHKAIKHRSIVKCPHSAPAKQPRSRLFKLSTATEIPDKITNLKLKNHPISSLKSPSPSPIKKKSEEKAFTTPKGQKSNSKSKNHPISNLKSKSKVEEKVFKTPKSQNSNSNHQRSRIKNDSVFLTAKPKFSSSPKKEIRKEACAKTRKLNLKIVQGAKRKSVPSRYFSNVSKKENNLKQNEKNAKHNEENSKQSGENLEKKKTPRPLWKINKPDLEQNEENSKQIEKKLKQNKGKSKQSGENLEKKKTPRPLWKINKPNLEQNEENSGSKVKILNEKKELEKGFEKKNSLRPLRKTIKPVSKPNFEEKKKEKNNFEKSKENLKSQKCKQNLKIEKSKENSKSEKFKENLKFQKSEKNNLENCEVFNENKENVSDNSAKRDENENTNKKQIKNKRSLTHKTNEYVPPQKMIKVEKKTVQVKTTNPKPFRFRTDERGILKEANTEKKMTVLPINVPELKNEPTNERGTARVKRVVPSKIKYQMNENQTERIAEKSNKSTNLASLAPRKDKIDLMEKRSKIIGKEPRFHVLAVPKHCTKKSPVPVPVN